MCGQNTELLKVKLGVHIMANGLWMVNLRPDNEVKFLLRKKLFVKIRRHLHFKIPFFLEVSKTFVNMFVFFRMLETFKASTVRRTVTIAVCGHCDDGRPVQTKQCNKCLRCRYGG